MVPKHMQILRELNRREWFAAAGGASLAACGAKLFGETDAKRPKVAAVVTEFTHRSHAHVILENFLEPYYFNGRLTDPGVDVVSLYVDQFPAPRHGARRGQAVQDRPSIPRSPAPCSLAASELAVDGVLSIGEHGRYPLNDRGQRMYPRKRFFDEIVAVFRSSGRVVPLFNDKHLSYRWDWSVEMMQVARELKIPFMAGSSVPLAQRRPPLEMPAGSVIEEAVSIHGGPLEGYDFHALEVLQSMVEARRGGETGVSEIQLLEGDAVWQAAADGRWTYALAEAAMRAEAGKDVGPLQELRRAGRRPAASGPRDPDQVPRRLAGDGAADRQALDALELRLPAGGTSRSRWRPASTSARGRTATCSRPCRMRFRSTSARSRRPIPSSARTW